MIIEVKVNCVKCQHSPTKGAMIVASDTEHEAGYVAEYCCETCDARVEVDHVFSLPPTK